MTQGTRFALALILLIPACSPREQSATTTTTTSTAPAQAAGLRGGVGGSVWFAPPGANDVAVRDFDIEMRSGAKTVARVKSDVNGIFRFREVAAGAYQLCWAAQGGWSAGCSPAEVSVGAQGVSVDPVHITPDPAKGGYIWGRIGFADGTAAVAIDPLFAIEKYPQVSVAGGAAVSANSDGEYVLAGIPAGVTALTVQYEQASVAKALDPKAIATGQKIAVTLPNHRPTVADVKAMQALPGSTLSLNAGITDGDNDALTYRWIIDGTPIESTGGTAQWKAPQQPGKHHAYVIAADGKGGYVRRAIAITLGTGQACPKPTTFFTCPPSRAPNVLCDQNRFLHIHRNDVPTAQAYYKAVDLRSSRLTLQKWLTVAGFVKADGTTAPHAHAAYTNDNDLGFGRDMHILKTGYGVFAYVTNYLNLCRLQDPLNARLASQAKPEDAGATVCMEFSSATYDGPSSPGGTDRIVKFFVYNENGDRFENAALDPSGAVPIPNLCLNCHGGNDYVAGGSVDLQARFLPFDLATFQYDPANTPDYAQFHELNKLVLDTLPSGTPIGELVTGWYRGGGDKPDLSFAPGDWNNSVGRKKLYDNVVARSCRTCHVAFDTNYSKTWATYAQFKGSSGSIRSRVDGGSMPHALITFMNFWSKNFWTDGKGPASLKCFTDHAGDEAKMGQCLATVP